MMVAIDDDMTAVVIETSDGVIVFPSVALALKNVRAIMPTFVTADVWQMVGNMPTLTIWHSIQERSALGGKQFSCRIWASPKAHYEYEAAVKQV